MRITAAAAEFLAIFHLSLHPRDCSALLIRSRALGPKSVWRPLMSYAGSTVATPTAAIDKENYWDKHHPEVPRKFLDSIRTEPWRGIFEPCSNHPLTEVQVEGKVPRGLEGTLFRNGPGRNRDGHRAYGHWFDGNGNISKIVFKDGKVYAQNSAIESERWDLDAPEGEKSAGTSGFWTPRPGGWLNNIFRLPANPRNTSVMIMKGKLYALCEAGKPVEIDPLTLQTLEEDDLGGIQASYSAHPKTDPSTGETFGIAIGGKLGAVEITRVSSEGTLDKGALYMHPTTTYWHDSALTEEYIVAVTSPYVATTARILRALLGFFPIGLAFKWDENLKSEALFFSRDTLKLARKVELPSVVSSYHLVNAFQEEEKPGIVTVLVCQHRGDREKLEATVRDVHGRRFTHENLCDIFKYEVDVKTGAVLSHEPMVPIEGALPMELPVIDFRYVTKRNRFVFTNALLGDAGFPNSVQRCDLHADGRTAWQTRDFGESRYAGEPIFVPKSESAPEGDGYIVVHVYNTKTHTTDVEVLDAQRLEGPPLCVAHVPWHMGASFHGIFTRETYLPPPTVV